VTVLRIYESFPIFRHVSGAGVKARQIVLRFSRVGPSKGPKQPGLSCPRSDRADAYRAQFEGEMAAVSCPAFAQDVNVSHFLADVVHIKDGRTGYPRGRT
jgi:hypothetical protein